MILQDVLDAIVSGIHTALPELYQCKSHPGRFTLDELRSFAVATPAVLVSLIGISKSVPVGDGTRDATVVFSAFVITSDQPPLLRDEASRNIVEALCSLIPQNRWQHECVHPAGEVTGTNQYSGELRQRGVSIWAVRWDQEVRIGQPFWNDAGVLPPELYVGIDPDVGSAHEGNYTLMEPASDT